MAFGNISTLYLPTAANAGTSQWGTDVRKLLDSADAGSDATTKTNHGTGGTAVVRTADPYTTTTADLDQTLYGWAVTPSDMNSVSGALRFLHAGNHVATLRVGHTAALAKNANFAMYVYRVGNAAGGRVRTQLGTANSGTVSIPAVAGELTVTITVALGEIILEADETLQYSFEVGAAGTTITGDIITIFTGTQSSVVGKIVIPTLGVLADTTGTSSDSVGSASGVMGKVLNTIGTAASVGDAVGSLGASAAMAGTVSGSSDAVGSLAATASQTGSADGSALTAGALGATAGLVGSASGVGDTAGLLGATAGLVGTTSGLADVTGVLGATGSMQGAAVGASEALGQTSSLSGTTGNATGTGDAAGVMGAVVGTVGTVEIGTGAAETTVRPLFVFDD